MTHLLACFWCVNNVRVSYWKWCVGLTRRGRYLFGDMSVTEMPDGEIVHGWVFRQWGTYAYGWPGRYLTAFFHSITDDTINYAQTDLEKVWVSIQHVRSSRLFLFGHRLCGCSLRQIMLACLKPWTQQVLYEMFMAYLTGVFAGEVVAGNAGKQKYNEKVTFTARTSLCTRLVPH